MGTELCDAHRACDVSSLVNSGLISRAQDAHDEAAARHASALADVTAAEEAVTKAAARMPAQLARAVDGEEITSSDLSAVHAGLLDAERFLAFCRQVAKQAAVAADHAAEVVRATTAVAYQAMMDRGIDLRIEGAIRADRARAGKQAWNVDPAEMDAAKTVFDEGNRLIALAESKGCRSGRHRSAAQPPPWPSTEEYERMTWHRGERA